MFHCFPFITDMILMKLIINDQRKLFAIQEEFSTKFPYLRLEFFTRPHQPGAASHRRLMRSGQRTIGECRTSHNSGALSVNEQMTVADLEQHFSEEFGLNVQVFRRSGNIWLETTITDGWTLEEQNRQGESLTQQVIKRSKEETAPYND